MEWETRKWRRIIEKGGKCEWKGEGRGKRKQRRMEGGKITGGIKGE